MPPKIVRLGFPKKNWGLPKSWHLGQNEFVQVAALGGGEFHVLVRNEALHHISPEELEPLVKKVRAINENPHKRSLPPFPVAAHRDYELVYCGPRTIDGVRMPFLAVRQRRVGELSVGLVSEKPLAPGRKAKLFLPNGSSNPRVFVVLNRTRKALQPGTLRQVIERDNVAGLTRRTLKDKGGRVSGFEVLPLRYPRKFG